MRAGHDELALVLRRVADDSGLVVGTSADVGYHAFVTAWLCRVRRFVRSPIVFAFDENLAALLTSMRVATHLVKVKGFGADDRERSFGTADFSAATHAKTKVHVMVLSHGFDLLFTDVDTAWVQDLRPFFRSALAASPELEYLVQLNWPQSEVNTGVFYARATPRGRRFFEVERNQKLRRTLQFEGDDQRCTNWLLGCGSPTSTAYLGPDACGRRRAVNVAGGARFRSVMTKSSPMECAWALIKRVHRVSSSWACDATTVFEVAASKCRNGTHAARLRYGLLPPLLFRTGWHLSDLRGKCRNTSRLPLLLHANFLNGHEAKKTHLEHAGMWCEESTHEAPA